MDRKICTGLGVLITASFCLQTGWTATGPADLSDTDNSTSELRPLIERFTLDRGNILRYYSVAGSPERRERLKKFFQTAQGALAAKNFDSLSQDGKVDYIVFRNGLEHELRTLDRETAEQAETAAYLPFSATVFSLEEARRKMGQVDGSVAAKALTELNTQIEAARRATDAKLRLENSPEAIRTRRVVANRAAMEANVLRNTLRTWFSFYDGYDPLFTWWAAETYRTADASLSSYATYLRSRVAGLTEGGEAAAALTAAPGGRGGGRGGASAGVSAYQASIAAAKPGSTDDIVGNPIGREGLMSELAFEMIPYTPEQLIAIANKEYAWCEAEMKKASNQMGLGDDWKKAVAKIKTMYVEPGKQPQLIRDLAREVDREDLVLVRRGRGLILRKRRR